MSQTGVRASAGAPQPDRAARKQEPRQHTDAADPHANAIESKEKAHAELSDAASSVRNLGERKEVEVSIPDGQPGDGEERVTPRTAHLKPPRAWSALDRSAHPRITSSRSVYSYERLNHIQEGAYGVVFRARPRDPSDSDTDSHPTVAVKKLKLDKSGVDSDGFPITSLREIQSLTMARHNANVVRLHEVCIGKTLDQIFLVMEFVEHDLKTLLTSFHRARTCFAPSEVKTLMHQLLSATVQLHEDFIVHRDLKTSNLLMNNRGILKVADFGLARRYTDPIAGWIAPSQPRSSTGTTQQREQREQDPLKGGMTDLVVTLWYRAPELLLLNQIAESREREHKHASHRASNSQPAPDQARAQDPPPLYDESIDVWSIGCIFAELLLTSKTGQGLFQGKDEVDQFRRIASVLGPPNTTIWPELPLYSRAHARIAASSTTPASEEDRIKRRLEREFHPTRLTPAALDLLFRLLHYDPKQRISAKHAIKHPFFTAEKPKMAHPDSFGSFPSVAAGERVPHGTPSAPNEHANRGHAKRKLDAAEKYPLQFDFDV
ncbi:hypothetical protein PaG_02343 [Moesziomyces aphidis]|uniref:Protein kinase domain-containing protein n=1 Tax=Moesziomyces aphidis TaxID=84754 RepID=W3VT78_MOEAP|nr:hypothetical protein PaG_02343 [Moesziomyces aphidis]